MNPTAAQLEAWLDREMARPGQARSRETLRTLLAHDVALWEAFRREA